MGALRQQPRGPLRSNRANSIARGLRIVQVGAGVGPFVSAGDVATVTGPYGYAKKFSGSPQYLTAANDFISPTSLTFLVIAAHDLLSGDQVYMSIGAATNNRVVLYKDSAGRAAIFSGAGATGVQAVNPGATLALGRTYVIGGRVSGSSSRDVWLDGVKLATNTAAATPLACERVTIGAQWTSGAPSLYLNGPVSLALAWDRPLSDAEMASVSANPWQLFDDGLDDEDDFATVAAVGHNGLAYPQGVATSASVGTVTTTAGARCSPLGVFAAASVGVVSASAGTSVAASPLGVTATGNVGTALASAGARAAPAGVVASVQVGAATATGGSASTAAPAGVSATAMVGPPSAIGGSSAMPPGVTASASVGQAIASAGVNGTAAPDGVAAAASIGSVVVSAGARCAPTGVRAFTSVGAVFATGNIAIPDPVFIDATKVPVVRTVTFDGCIRTVVFKGGIRTTVFAGSTRTVRF